MRLMNKQQQQQQLLKGDAHNWHQNGLATAEKELRPDTLASYTAAMDHHFHDPHQRTIYLFIYLFLINACNVKVMARFTELNT
jgi:hypothetical protein